MDFFKSIAPAQDNTGAAIVSAMAQRDAAARQAAASRAQAALQAYTQEQAQMKQAQQYEEQMAQQAREQASTEAYRQAQMKQQMDLQKMQEAGADRRQVLSNRASMEHLKAQQDFNKSQTDEAYKRQLVTEANQTALRKYELEFAAGRGEYQSRLNAALEARNTYVTRALQGGFTTPQQAAADAHLYFPDPAPMVPTMPQGQAPPTVGGIRERAPGDYTNAPQPQEQPATRPTGTPAVPAAPGAAAPVAGKQFRSFPLILLDIAQGKEISPEEQAYALQQGGSTYGPMVLNAMAAKAEATRNANAKQAEALIKGGKDAEAISTAKNVAGAFQAAGLASPEEYLSGKAKLSGQTVRVGNATIPAQQALDMYKSSKTLVETVYGKGTSDTLLGMTGVTSPRAPRPVSAPGEWKPTYPPPKTGSAEAIIRGKAPNPVPSIAKQGLEATIGVGAEALGKIPGAVGLERNTSATVRDQSLDLAARALGGNDPDFMRRYHAMPREARLDMFRKYLYKTGAIENAWSEEGERRKLGVAGVGPAWERHSPYYAADPSGAGHYIVAPRQTTEQEEVILTALEQNGLQVIRSGEGSKTTKAGRSATATGRGDVTDPAYAHPSGIPGGLEVGEATLAITSVPSLARGVFGGIKALRGAPPEVLAKYTGGPKPPKVKGKPAKAEAAAAIDKAKAAQAVEAEAAPKPGKAAPAPATVPGEREIQGAPTSKRIDPKTGEIKGAAPAPNKTRASREESVINARAERLRGNIPPEARLPGYPSEKAPFVTPQGLPENVRPVAVVNPVTGKSEIRLVPTAPPRPGGTGVVGTGDIQVPPGGRLTPGEPVAHQARRITPTPEVPNYPRAERVRPPGPLLPAEPTPPPVQLPPGYGQIYPDEAIPHTNWIPGYGRAEAIPPSVAPIPQEGPVGYGAVEVPNVGRFHWPTEKRPPNVRIVQAPEEPPPTVAPTTPGAPTAPAAAPAPPPAAAQREISQTPPEPAAAPPAAPAAAAPPKPAPPKPAEPAKPAELTPGQKLAKSVEDKKAKAAQALKPPEASEEAFVDTMRQYRAIVDKLKDPKSIAKAREDFLGREDINKQNIVASEVQRLKPDLDDDAMLAEIERVLDISNKDDFAKGVRVSANQTWEKVRQEILNPKGAKTEPVKPAKVPKDEETPTVVEPKPLDKPTDDSLPPDIAALGKGTPPPAAPKPATVPDEPAKPTPPVVPSRRISSKLGESIVTAERHPTSLSSQIYKTREDAVKALGDKVDEFDVTEVPTEIGGVLYLHKKGKMFNDMQAGWRRYQMLSKREVETVKDPRTERPNTRGYVLEKDLPPLDATYIDLLDIDPVWVANNKPVSGITLSGGYKMGTYPSEVMKGLGKDVSTADKFKAKAAFEKEKAEAWKKYVEELRDEWSKHLRSK